MVEEWAFELGKGIGRVFLNPLLYWAFFLIVLAGIRRIKKERLDFGTKIFDVFSEWKGSWKLSIIFGLIVSIISLGIGMVIPYESLLLLAIITIILSIFLHFHTLSVAYTIGVTYLVLLFLPFLMENQTVLNPDLFSETNFTALSILLGIFLFVEAFLTFTVKRNETFPSLTLSNRGIWIGKHQVKRMAIIPFFTLLPTGLIGPIGDYWPMLDFGQTSFSLILFPMLVGIDFSVKGSLPIHAAKRQAKQILLLAIVVTVLAAASIYAVWLSFASVILAITGKEFIRYRFRTQDRTNMAYFQPENDGLKIVGIIPGTTASRLNVFVGETIAKVNGKRVYTEKDFYLALQASGAYFKLDVLDDAKEVRFVQGAMYEGDHHELGFVFASAPHHLNKQAAN
ncbi:PDZ domain-containing protein [Oceanobacillus piezotolerans]|uniref:PDZ domain-containing protein n=1 Tax=Oceanobacillus piezotolerans TaxID=2448030 RepID=A0A498D8D2_9BACI|nr:PDZ domain-containing protein [Oceanobacillus piezotolerans]RLL46643.1 PDZ domain-containing protein [Oceanobacillus piezotolerans]